MPEAVDTVDIRKPELPSIRDTRKPREHHGITSQPTIHLDEIREEIAQQEVDATNRTPRLALRFADARPQKEKPTGFRRILETTKKVIGEVSVHGERVLTEDMDERTIAYLILTMQQNRTRGANSQIKSFNAVDIMRDAGYTGLNPEGTDYEDEWPVQYSRAHQVLRSLREIQAIEYLSPDTAESELDPGYTVKPEQLGLLHQLATRATEVSSRFTTSALPPIKG